MPGAVSINSRYDVAVIGGGHNGLVAACYLAKAGQSVLVLERNAELGGATQSKRLFAGIDARLSAYAYLVSLFPKKIVDDLGLNLRLRSRGTASYTPSLANGCFREVLIRNNDPGANRDAFRTLTGSDRDYDEFQELQRLQQQLASVVWPSLTQPLVTRSQMRRRLSSAGQAAWQAFVEEPLGNVIERLLSDDLIRGLVFTDAKIGLSTHPHDSSLRQNRCFLYHVIGNGTGEWRVPVGGMGALVDELVRIAAGTGSVTFVTSATVVRVDPGSNRATVTFEQAGTVRDVDADTVLCNASTDVLARLLGNVHEAPGDVPAGAGFKINMLLSRLPKLRSANCAPEAAFAGTFHIDEGYEQMQSSFADSVAGRVPETPPGEIYCHTLTDNSILSDELNRQGTHTLTLFGLDMPYRLFEDDNDRVRRDVLAKYLSGINQFLAEPIESCLAVDANGDPCIDAMSPVDLQNKLHLPQGNIFHGDLTWPFAESDEQAGLWGVETEHPRILLCGSSAVRGGAVSGIPGHNAAMKVLQDRTT
ncbi:MAG: NAD(P)/FAD-dependent oxidoreductase [Planctomycetaceae bacterium]